MRDVYIRSDTPCTSISPTNNVVITDHLFVFPPHHLDKLVVLVLSTLLEKTSVHNLPYSIPVTTIEYTMKEVVKCKQEEDITVSIPPYIVTISVSWNWSSHTTSSPFLAHNKFNLHPHITTH